MKCVWARKVSEYCWQIEHNQADGKIIMVSSMFLLNVKANFVHRFASDLNEIISSPTCFLWKPLLEAPKAVGKAFQSGKQSRKRSRK